MMRCLKYASISLLLLVACGNPYRKLQETTIPAITPALEKPVIRKELYRCVVDGRILFKKFHLSGLLLFKSFEDGSTRAVFQNEMGFSFFDFKWDARGSFQVMRIIPQLDKPALVKTLQKDMNLVLMKNLDESSRKSFRNTATGEAYDRFTLDKGYAYYVSKGEELKRIENAGRRKVITIGLNGYQSRKSLPSAMFFRHHKAHFTIDLKRINEEDAQ